MAQEAKQTEKVVPPYVAYKTFRGFIDRVRIALPNRIDRSVMGNKMSGAIQGQLISTMKFLGLIGDQGHPTEKLARLAKSEGAERQKALGEALTTAYGFLQGVDLRSVTARQLHEQFDGTGAQGQTIRKCIAFFVSAAKDAGLPLSPYITEKTRGTRNGSPRARRQQAQPQPDQTGLGDLGSQEHTGTMSWSQLLLSKFPSFDPSWPDEVKSKWFDAFDRLMRSGQTADEKER